MRITHVLWLLSILLLASKLVTTYDNCANLVVSAEFDRSFEQVTLSKGNWQSNDSYLPFYPLNSYPDKWNPGYNFFTTDASDGERILATGSYGFPGNTTWYTTVQLGSTTSNIFFAFDFRAASNIHSSIINKNSSRKATLQITNNMSDPLDEEFFSFPANQLITDTQTITATYEISRMQNSTITITFNIEADGSNSGPSFMQMDNLRLLCCEPGKISTVLFGDKPTCQPCPTGFGKTTANKCEPCACGFTSNVGASCHNCQQFAVANSTSCFFCSPGLQPLASKCGCELCKAGYYSADGKQCNYCEAGTFSAVGAASCLPCKCGSQPNDKRTSCEACVPGKHASFVGRQQAKGCEQCEANTYSDVYGACDCTPCPSNSFSPPGSTTCTPL